MYWSVWMVPIREAQQSHLSGGFGENRPSELIFSAAIYDPERTLENGWA
jgi:hypothetical protein